MSKLPLPREASSGAMAPASSSRLRSLDGLRGLAAVIVVFHHLSLTMPTIAGGNPPTPVSPVTWSLEWWLIATPAHLFVAGPEAVLVFFVLSGLVVALPVIRKVNFDWIGYYVQRMLRLYLPSIASVLLAAVWILVSHQDRATATSAWTAGSSYSSVGVKDVISGFDLLFGNININNPLWSLRWEVLFSLALPLFVIIAVATRRFWWVVLVLCGIASVVGQHLTNDSLRYLPVFLLGTVVAVKLPDIQSWMAVLAPRRWFTPVAATIVVASLLAITLPWVTDAIWPKSQLLHVASSAVVVIGAFGLVIGAGFWNPLSALLSTRLFRWLGRISFSLYLVHVPIIIAMSSLFGPDNLAISIPVSLLLSLIAGELFARFVEQPSHRLSRRAGTAASGSFSRWTSALTPPN
ncbi:acyltransferase family protein [Lacisediminihabitans sp. FW035]